MLDVLTGRPVMWMQGVMGDRTIRWMLASLAVASVLGMLTFVLVRLQAVETLQTENLRLASAVTELQRRFEAHLTAHQERMTLIEQTMFGTVVPEIAADQTKKPVVVLSAQAQWQLNRDRELRNRLAVLEKWRMTHEDAR